MPRLGLGESRKGLSKIIARAGERPEPNEVPWRSRDASGVRGRNAQTPGGGFNRGLVAECADPQCG